MKQFVLFFLFLNSLTLFGQNRTYPILDSLNKIDVKQYVPSKTQYDKNLKKYTNRSLLEHFQWLIDSCKVAGEKYNIDINGILKSRGIEYLYGVSRNIPLIYVDDKLLNPFDGTFNFSTGYLLENIYKCVYYKPQQSFDFFEESDPNRTNGVLLFYTSKHWFENSSYVERYKDNL